jgi:hypothetical protein
MRPQTAAIHPLGFTVSTLRRNVRCASLPFESLHHSSHN